MDRTVRLVLVDGAGAPLGALPPFDVSEPWWQEVAGVVAEARARFGVEVAVLRLLHADRPEPPGGTVTYLAQLDREPAPGLPAPPVAGERVEATAGERVKATGGEPPSGQVPAAEVAAAVVSGGPGPLVGRDRAAHPLRAPYAEPGGPAGSLAWAGKVLADAGWAGLTATQIRTWNLSAIWRLDESPPPGGPTVDGFAADGRPRRAWLKQVPRFFRHEAAVLRWLGAAVPGAAPALLAAGDEGRMLLRDAPGVDGWDAGPVERDAIAAVQHRIQVASLGALDALVASGVPDRRGPLLCRWVRDRLTGWRPAPGEDAPDVAELLANMDARVAAVRDCGLPDTLVHGDLHGGNARLGGGGPPVVIDWGDCVVGNPAADILRLTERLDGADRDALISSWAARWRRTVPGCEPERAVRLWRPVSELHLAAVYAAFVANIEPSERPYHAGDVAPSLRRAAEFA
ncbi:phosphotransferase [Phytohabitans houttuyneae]|uniref:phosphotransferase n=1 Tax=Phytohabitans houttuyneae TaxID=1076126 RepID=UPI001565D858|nr:phosphotransferase [Phytohabitans houttuyneae]